MTYSKQIQSWERDGKKDDQTWFGYLLSYTEMIHTFFWEMGNLVINILVLQGKLMEWYGKHEWTQSFPANTWGLVA